MQNSAGLTVNLLISKETEESACVYVGIHWKTVGRCITAFRGKGPEAPERGVLWGGGKIHKATKRDKEVRREQKESD
jgi:hypothetical protein